MAKATKTEKVVKTTTVKLELSVREASLLRDLLAHVGGEPSGPRGEFDEIFDSLVKLDLKRDHSYDLDGNVTASADLFA
jgi:hypothetical protein